MKHYSKKIIQLSYSLYTNQQSLSSCHNLTVPHFSDINQAQ